MEVLGEIPSPPLSPDRASSGPPWSVVFAPGLGLIAPWMLVLPVLLCYDAYARRSLVRVGRQFNAARKVSQDRSRYLYFCCCKSFTRTHSFIHAMLQVLLDTIEPISLKFMTDLQKWRGPLFRGALAWIACAAISTVTLASLLLLEHPGVYSAVFSPLHAPCAQAVVLTCGGSAVYACILIGIISKLFGSSARKCQNFIVMLMLLAVLFPITTSAMATASVCGVTSGLPITNMMVPIFILAGIIAVILIIIMVIVIKNGVCDCDPLRMLFFVSGWAVVAALVAGAVLTIVNVDGPHCFNWAFVGAALLVLIVSGSGLFSIVSTEIYEHP